MKKLSQLLTILTGICLPVFLLLISVQSLPAKSEIEKVKDVETKSYIEKELEVILAKTNRMSSYKMSKYEF